MIVIGDVNAAAQPFCAGFARLALYWFTTCCFTCASHWSGVIDVGDGGVDAAQRERIGRVDGSVWKNWTPPAKLLIVRPVSGSSRIPVRQADADEHGRAGRARESASWIVKPPMPAIEKPPWRPAKKTR